MKILFVSPYLPYAGVDHAGGTTFYNVVKSLSQRHEISLISFIRDEGELQHIAELGRYCAFIDTVLLSNRLVSKVRRKIGQFFHPITLASWNSDEMRKKISSLTQREHFDVIHFNFTQMSQYADAAQNAPKVLDEGDVAFLPFYQDYIAGGASGIGRTRLFLEWTRLQAYEISACQKFDAILTRSEKDRKLLLALNPGLNVSILPPWVELYDSHPSGQEATDDKTLLFLGAMWRTINAQAVTYFCHSILPLVRQEIPDVKFQIVGSSPLEEVKRLSRDKNIIVTGYVDDIRPYYTECAIFVAPLLAAGGIIVKILDAMAAGKPVVTTSAGNEGIGAAHGKDLIVADSPEEFARGIIELLQDPGLRERIGNSGREFVRAKYNWDRTIQDLEKLYQGLLEKS